ncbi:MAG: hypothetical protein OEZ65_01390 [Gemmatimonadota bacterium]|nr:hypothetical protein [Gemmatimonadota bacterium]MDH5758210.1 hypothetical protein [Gemmatimonadota bacterium]
MSDQTYPPTAHTGAETEIASLLAQAGWLAAADQIVSGVSHDLNGRIGSLMGLLDLLSHGDGDDLPVMSFLEEEVHRLEGSVELLRMIRGPLTADPEPLPAEAVGERILKLHERRRGFERQETVLAMEEALPPVLVNWSRFGRTLVLLVGMVGAGVLDGDDRRLTISFTGSPDQLTIRIGPLAGKAELCLDALRQVAALDGATITPVGDEAVEVSLPSLTRARAAV